MKKKIYLSGPMAGHEADEITERFKAWERALRLSLGDEWAVVNPSALFPGTYTDAFDYEELLNIDKAILGTCDAIFMLPGWEDSNGANVELERAEEIGIPIHGWAGEEGPEEYRLYANNEEALVIPKEAK